ncbi:MAG: anthranilate phosphoribosyltransferase [Chlamydiota bacterium]
MDTARFIRNELPRLFPPPPRPVSAALLKLGRRLAEGGSLRAADAASAVEIMMGGECDPYEAGLFLSAFQSSDCTPRALAAMAGVMRAKMVPVAVRPGEGPLGDNCGTGGDSLHLFNVSTAAMFILAAAGVRIAKHGNRASTSRCGSADALEALGALIDLGPEEVARCIGEAGIGFMFAPRYHPAMKNVSEVRRALPFRTVFNLLGPLCNPAPVDFQILGVYHPDMLDLAGKAARILKIPRALIVCGRTGHKGAWMDEVSVSGATRAVMLSKGRMRPVEITPRALGIPCAPIDSLRGGTPRRNAGILTEILAGKDKGPRRDICLANAAVGLYAAGTAPDLREGMARAREALESGRAIEKLEQFIAATRRLGQK